MEPVDEQFQGRRPFLANTALLLLALVATGVAAAFVVPWFSWSKPGGTLLALYAPLSEGGAQLTAEYDAGGVAKAWSSENEILVPAALALAADMRKSEREAINKFFLRQGESGELPSRELFARMAGAQVYQVRGRRLTPDGKASDSQLLAIRNERADYLVALYDPATDAETFFDPPVPIFDADLTPGRTWEAKGKLLGRNPLDYTYSGKVIERTRFKNETGTFEDTLKVETRLTFLADGKVGYDRVSLYWLAPGIGSVESHALDAAGKIETRTVLCSVTDRNLHPPALPKIPRASAKGSLTGSTETWELSRFASTRGSTDNSESSIPPTWIPTEPPLLLTARYGGALMAFNADETGTPAAWRFQTGGTIYGPPAFDAERNRIYVGASDKRLYALDTRGLFLWSFETGDNIVTRPVVAEGVVIFASEDRHVYFLSAETGAEVHPRKKLGSAVVSSPVLAGNQVIFGCDDGRLYALDAKTGELKEPVELGSPIEAPVIAAGQRVFAATHGGDIYAIDPAMGEQHWSAHVGSELRSAPVVAGERLYVVNDQGRLSAYDVEKGRQLWSSKEDDYVGPPVVVGEMLIIGGRNGDVHAVDFAGERRKKWEAAGATSPTDGTAALRIGGSAGGDAIWFGDARSVIRRLGPAIAGPIALKASWLLPFSKEPLTRHFLSIAPVAYGNQALIVDGERDIFLLDPATGKGSRTGSFGEKLAPAIEPTVAGDTLLATAGTTLYANALPTGAARWKLELKESGSLPVTVAGDTVLWLTQHFPPDVDGKTQLPVGTLHALDLKTGAPRWQRPLSGFTGIGEALVSGSMILTSAPVAAFDLASGEPLWQAQLTDSPLGGGTLDETGDTLFVGAINAQTSVGSIAAVRTADGSVVWQQPIGSSPLHPLERPALAGDVLVVPLWSGDVIGVAANGGAELWRHQPVKPRYGGIAVGAGRVWFTQNNARIVALDAKTGKLAAQLALDIDIGNIPAFAPRPLIIGDHVVVPLAMALLGLKNPPAPVASEAPTQP